MYTCLTIAGSDSSGGAGIQADIKTMQANGVFAMSAITALTAQNTLGVTDIMEAGEDFLEKEIDAVFTDIRPDAVKIGMLSNSELIECVARKLKQYKAEHVVLDPVMVATSGSKLMRSDSVNTMIEKLFPLAEVITPNIPEAEVIAGMTIKDELSMEEAAKKIYDRCGCAVLLKGGHSISDANDLLYNGQITWLRGERIDNPNTHGTGCTLSSAIAANLAKGRDLVTAIKLAKEYLTGAIAAGLNLGAGSGPLNHAYDIKSNYMH